MVWNSRSVVSCSARYRSTLRMSCWSWARPESSQKTAGTPVALARTTASLTQSRIEASLVWHILQMSPASTSWLVSTLPEASTTRTVPAAGISKVLSWEPYSSAFFAISPTLGTLPIDAGS